MNIKGFDKDLKCRGMQYEIGKTYDTGATELELCTATVFHYCKSLQQVHSHYGVNGKNRFCEIEVLGAEVTDEEKCGSNKIKILREIMGEELDILCDRVNGNTGLFNSGRGNSGDWNSGDWNSGDRNSGDRNSGDMNSGCGNSGDRNSGCGNSGDWNSGCGNSGHRNSGHRNSGDRNSGDWNSGDWNSCDGSNGVFCTKEPDINIFNMPSGMTLKEFRNSRYFNALFSAPFNLTEVVGDKLITHTYKDACAAWWDAMSEENKEIVKSIPNFDAEIFKEITGISI